MTTTPGVAAAKTIVTAPSPGTAAAAAAAGGPGVPALQGGDTIAPAPDGYRPVKTPGPSSTV